MRIGVDATCWQNNRGYGRQARALLRNLVSIDNQNQYIFFTDSSENLGDIPSGVELRTVRANLPTSQAAAVNSHRSIHDLWWMSRALSDPRLDILFFPTVYSYVPVIGKAKILLGIHDVIPEKYPHLTIPRPIERRFWQAKSALGRWQSDAIVTVSEYSRNQIATYFNISPQKIYVVGEANDPVFRVLENPQVTPQLRNLGISPEQRIIIYVGGFGPHKNLENLVSVFSKIVQQAKTSDITLVMVGEFRQEVFYSQYEVLKRTIEDLKLIKRVIFTGYLPDEELVVLLNISTVLVLPSLMEGFGLPAVEAAACGCPVIATAASPLPQLLGEGGLFIDPEQPSELEQALQMVLSSLELRKKLRTEGLAAIRLLTWETAAHQMLDLLNQITKS